MVEKKKGEKLILIPELTPSLARMITAKRQELKKPIRWFSVPTCYRYERPQKGRRREFKQINMDILGEDSIFSEFGATSEQFQIYYNNRRFIDSVCELILNVPKEKIPLVYKILDKADKMEDSEYEKYVLAIFQDEVIIQGITKLIEATSLKDLLNRFEDISEEFYDTIGYKELDIKS
ncbi:MAG: aminoacyl--tRNA ligase-related protein [Promethearchaeota archaeon]